jgi:signal transduction histidine kinase/ligand-binding sensor domain-containing protein
VAGLAALVLAAPLAARAQEPEASYEPLPRGQQWDAMTMFHGMPSRNVRAIAQDREGLLWLATDAGLVRYDGQRVERVPLDEGPVAVLALASDREGRLWAGTERGAFVRTAAGTRALPQTAGHPIAAVLVGQGRVTLASRSGRVFTCSADGQHVEALGPDEARLLRRADGRDLEIVSLGRRGTRVVVGTRGRGLLEVGGAGVLEIKHPLRPFFVNAIVADGERLVFGADTGPSGRGLFALEGDSIRPLDLPTGSVEALALGPGGDVWAGTSGRGLVRLRAGRPPETFTLESTGGGLLSNRVLAVTVDRDGVVWVGTDRGVSRYDPSAPRTERLGASPESSFVHALLATSDGRLWAGTQLGLFVRSDPAGPWREEPALATEAVHALGTTPDGRLLAGTSSGLHVLQGGDVETWQPAPSAGSAADLVGSGAPAGEPGSVRSIQARGGATWLATFGRGLERLDGDQRTLVWPAADDPGLREVVSLAAVGDALWVGTAGAGTFVMAGESVSRDEALSALGTLRAAAPDGERGTWVGTSRGLFRVVDGRAQPVVEGEDVRALAPAKGVPGSVWCATRGSGLLNVAVTADLGVLRSRVDTEYGLPSESLFALLATDAGFLLGTNRGLVHYDPGRGAPSLRVVRVLGRRPYTPDEWRALRLDYPQNGLLIQAAAIGSRTYPERFQYAFSLEDASGSAVSRTVSRDSQFAAESLAPGRYRVTARAYGTNLVPSAPVHLRFEVAGAPVPWTSIGLAGLLALALVALGWGGLQYRRLRAANAALSETRRQLVQETENERRRIARDLHDQTLADLRGLLIATTGGDAVSAALRADVEAISSEVRRICEDLSPSVLENVGLAAALEWALDETVRHRATDEPLHGTFACDDDLADRLGLEPATEIQVYRVVQEALANAARHSGARELRLAVSLSEDGVLEVALEDDGRGFDPSTARPGRGLSNMRSRASLIGATIAWRPREGGGTRFVLSRRGAAAAPPHNE